MQNAALIVVDVQRGFTPGGNLAVAHADQIIPNINQLAQYFDNIVITQDWHQKIIFHLLKIMRANSHLKQSN